MDVVQCLDKECGALGTELAWMAEHTRENPEHKGFKIKMYFCPGYPACQFKSFYPETMVKHQEHADHKGRPNLWWDVGS